MWHKNEFAFIRLSVNYIIRHGLLPQKPLKLIWFVIEPPVTDDYSNWSWAYWRIRPQELFGHSSLRKLSMSSSIERLYLGAVKYKYSRSFNQYKTPTSNLVTCSAVKAPSSLLLISSPDWIRSPAGVSLMSKQVFYPTMLPWNSAGNAPKSREQYLRWNRKNMGHPHVVDVLQARSLCMSSSWALILWELSAEWCNVLNLHILFR